MRESTVKRQTRAQCRAHGYRALKMHGSAFSDAGLPDFLILPPKKRPGVRVWVELKVGTRALDDAQLSCCVDLAERGERVFVLRWISKGNLRLERAESGRTLAEGFGYDQIIEELEQATGVAVR